MCANREIVEPDLKSVSCGVQDEGPPQTNAHAPTTTTTMTTTTTTTSQSTTNTTTIVAAAATVVVAEATGNLLEDTAIKKRKTRRGKSKRRNPNPYTKLSWQQRKNNRNKFRTNILNHALAPFNSNQFLMEDHGDVQELDDKLNKSDGAGTSTNPPRTRDSSFSVDSDADFYSSPEDEEEFLTKEFDTAYENLQAERLQSMSKAELIEEYLQLENKVELLTKRLRGKSTTIASSACSVVTEDPKKETETDVQEEINKLIVENDELRRENEHLRSGMCRTASSFSSSMDSESDSSSSTCNSSSSTSNADEQMKDEIVENGHNDHDENEHHSEPTSIL